MAKILKPYVVPLDSGLAKEILNTPLPNEDSREVTTIGQRVEAATKAVDEANAYLETSPLARLVADTLMRKLKKRGVPSIRVLPDGTVVLHVSYTDTEKPKSQPPTVKRPSHKSSLPKLDALRRMAKDRGIDISDLGRKRRAIYERLQESQPPTRMVDEESESDLIPPTPPRRR